jgi:pimeloyl-ACP methyl ester carboxylesterase
MQGALRAGSARCAVDVVPDGLARLEIVPEASHDALADNPVETYRLVREFVGNLGSVSE